MKDPFLYQPSAESLRGKASSDGQLRIRYAIECFWPDGGSLYLSTATDEDGYRPDGDEILLLGKARDRITSLLAALEEQE